MSVLNLSGDEAPEVRSVLVLSARCDLCVSVPTLYGVPRAGRHQFLPVHLRLPGWSPSATPGLLTLHFIFRFVVSVGTNSVRRAMGCVRPVDKDTQRTPLTSSLSLRRRWPRSRWIHQAVLRNRQTMLIDSTLQAEKRQKDQAKKQKITENRKHLANVRVVQKNLVFVVGLSPRLADPEILKKPDYFGKFGKIHKVVINHSTQYAGSQMQVRDQTLSESPEGKVGCVLGPKRECLRYVSTI